MKKLLFFLIAIAISKTYAQENNKKCDFAFSPGIILQKEVFAEANLMVGKIIINKMFVGMSGARLGLETNFKNNSEFTIAPKVGFEISATLVAARLSAINYFQNGNSEFRIVPEIGISFGGLANLTYGYGIRFQKPEISNLSQHRLSLTFTLNKRIIKECL